MSRDSLACAVQFSIASIGIGTVIWDSDGSVASKATENHPE